MVWLQGVALTGFSPRVAAGASFAERIAADSSPTDQTIARILVTLLTVGVWFLMLYVFRFNFSLNIGG